MSAPADSAAPNPAKGKFEPKTPVTLAPPKTDPIPVAELAKCTGADPSLPTWVAIKGKIYDVTGNKAYGPDGSYRLFSGRDASRALGKTSLKEEDVRPDWQDLPDEEKKTLDDWVTFFAKRYNVVGVVEGATNME